MLRHSVYVNLDCINIYILTLQIKSLHNTGTYRKLRDSKYSFQGCLMPCSGRFPAVDCILFSRHIVCKIFCLFSSAMLLILFWDRIRYGYTIQLFFACMCMYYRIIFTGNIQATRYGQLCSHRYIEIQYLLTFFNTFYQQICVAVGSL